MAEVTRGWRRERADNPGRRVVLATGDATPAIAPTFGRGRHACPGHAVAAALAAGVLEAFREAGWQAVPGQSVGYEPRPNLRVPHQVLLARA